MSADEFARLDNADVHRRIRAYVPENLPYEYMPYDFTEPGYDKIGNHFGVVFVDPEDREIPYIAQENGESIREGDIYVRRNGESTKATSKELGKLIKKRLIAERRAVLATAKLSALLDALDEIARTHMNVSSRRLPLTTAAMALIHPHAYQAEERYLRFLNETMNLLERKINEFLQGL
jgi:hypothetical protein